LPRSPARALGVRDHGFHARSIFVRLVRALARGLDWISDGGMTRMWKSIALCAALYLCAAVGLAASARWIEPSAWAVATAVGLCVIGAVLIWSAPAAQQDADARARKLEAVEAAPVDPMGVTDKLPIIS
jgi:hypothetical protein